jgi:hypothetical protein
LNQREPRPPRSADHDAGATVERASSDRRGLLWGKGLAVALEPRVTMEGVTRIPHIGIGGRVQQSVTVSRVPGDG